MKCEHARPALQCPAPACTHWSRISGVSGERHDSGEYLLRAPQLRQGACSKDYLGSRWAGGQGDDVHLPLSPQSVHDCMHPSHVVRRICPNWLHASSPIRCVHLFRLHSERANASNGSMHLPPDGRQRVSDVRTLLIRSLRISGGGSWPTETLDQATAISANSSIEIVPI